MKYLILTAMLVASVAIAADKIVVPLSQTEGLLISAPGASAITTERIPIQSIGTPPVTPGPVVPVLTDKLPDVVKAALATVPEYENRDNHRAGIAFVMQFLSQGVEKRATAESMAIVRQGCDSVTGADTAKWITFWTMVDAKTRVMPSSQYATSLPIIAESLTAGLAAGPEGAEDFEYAGGDVEVASFGTINQAAIGELMSLSGADNYGKLLPDGFLAELFKMLLPLLLKLLMGV